MTSFTPKLAVRENARPLANYRWIEIQMWN